MAEKQEVSNNDGQSLRPDKEPCVIELPEDSGPRRKYFCEYCSKAFTRSGHLEMHRRTHTGERPYVCQYCSRAFTQSSALYRHHKTCANCPNKGNAEQLSKNVTVVVVSSAKPKHQETAFPVSLSKSVSVHPVNGTFPDNNSSGDEDDDILFVCCDRTFNCSADYDKHLEIHHPNSHAPLPPTGNSEREKRSTSTVHLSGNSYGQYVTNNVASYNLSRHFSPVLQQRTSTGTSGPRSMDKDSRIVYAFNDANRQDTVTINLSEHSVCDGGGVDSDSSTSNIFLSNEYSNSVKRQVVSNLIASPESSTNAVDNDAVVIDDDDDDDDGDEDICIETVSLASEQNVNRRIRDNEIFIKEKSSSQKKQISRSASPKKPNQKFLRDSVPLYEVVHDSNYYDANPSQKNLSDSFYIKNLTNILSFENSMSCNTNETKDTNSLQKSSEATEDSTGTKKSCNRTVSGHNRLKTSRLRSCQFCSRQFTRASHLTQHLRTHTGERPFRCEYCGNAFTQSSALNRHLKTCNVAQSVNSSVAGNTATSHQPSASFLDAGNDGCFPYPRDVVQQSNSLDSHLKAVDDHSDADIDAKSSLSAHGGSKSAAPNNKADENCSSVSPTYVSKDKSPKTKMTDKSVEGEALRSRNKKPFLQKFLRSERLLRCDICRLEFVSRQHLATHVRKHLRTNSASLKRVPSLSRNLSASSVTRTLLSAKNKHVFRNKIYNNLKYKRNFEKQKSFVLATNSQPGPAPSKTKGFLFSEKMAKDAGNPVDGSKSGDCKTFDLPYLSMGSPVRKLSSEKEKILLSFQSLKKTTKNSVDIGTGKKPWNSLETNSHRPNKVSTHIYTCNICNKSFYSDLLFRIHRSTHSLKPKTKNVSLSTDAKKETLPILHAERTSKSDTNTFQKDACKTYPCVYCHKRFLRHSHLETHMRTHTGEKPFRCESCGRAFSQSSARNRHRNKACFVARQIMNSALVPADSLPSVDLPDPAVQDITKRQDESVLFTCCDQSFHSSIDLNTHILNHKGSKETVLDISKSGSQLRSQYGAKFQDCQESDTHSIQVADSVSGTPIKDEENTDNDLSVYRTKPSLVDKKEEKNKIITGKTMQGMFRSNDKTSVSESKQDSSSTDNELADLDGKIFDNALQVLHSSPQMMLEGNLQQASSCQAKDIPPLETESGSMEVVNSHNCPDPSDLCMSLSDIPQPNVSLSLGSEFVDIMDADLPGISNAIPSSQEEESLPQQKDTFLEYSPETPPFVSECVLPKSAGTSDLIDGIDKRTKEGMSSNSVTTPELNRQGKNYSCDYCNKMFSRLDHLNDHVRMHTGETFFCPSCSTGFTLASSFSKHFKMCTGATEDSNTESVLINHLDTRCTVNMGAGLQMSNAEALADNSKTDGSIKTSKQLNLGSFEAALKIKDSINNSLQEPLENWTLSLFSNCDFVKNENRNSSVSFESKKEESARDTGNSDSEKVINSNQLKNNPTGLTLNARGEEIPTKPDPQVSTDQLTTSHFGKHFTGTNCSAVEKPYVCWFCKEIYILPSDFEQHLKICGAPTTFPNLSSVSASKEVGAEDEDSNSKFADITLFTPVTESGNITPVTESGNLSDCDDRVSDGAQSKDKNKVDIISQSPQQESKAGNPIHNSEGVQEEEKENAIKTFECVELISEGPQKDSVEESDPNPDNHSKYAPDSVVLEDNVFESKNNNIDGYLTPNENINPTDQHITHNGNPSNIALADIDFTLACRRNDDFEKDFSSVHPTKQTLIPSPDNTPNIPSISLEIQSSPEASSDSVVFLCCQQTYTQIQDYNQHLFNCHQENENTDETEDLKQGQLSQSSKVDSAPSQDSVSVSRRTVVGDSPLPQSNTTDQRRFVCSYCSRGFSRSSHLIQHMRTHTGERPYPCQFCNKAFTQTSALNRHLKTCVAAKLFYNGSLKITSTNYGAILPEFQQNLTQSHSSVSSSSPPLPAQLLDDPKHGKTNILQQPSDLNFKIADKISFDEINEEMIECDHCGFKCQKLDDFTRHYKTCSSTDNTLNKTTHHKNGNLHEGVGDDNVDGIYNPKAEQKSNIHGDDKDTELSQFEIKKEVLDVVFECEFCHKLFSKESELTLHRDSHFAPSEQPQWNTVLDFSDGEMRKVIKDEEMCTFNCCGQVFFSSESYSFHLENHANHLNQALSQNPEGVKSPKRIDIKKETDDHDQIGCNNTLGDDLFLESHLQGRQLQFTSKNKYDDLIGKKICDRVLDLFSTGRSTVSNTDFRFQVSDPIREISHSETSVSSQGIAVRDIDKHTTPSNSPTISKDPQKTDLSSSANETMLTNCTNMDWLQWENYITGQHKTSPLSTARVLPRDKKFVCDYCDKKFTRNSHLVMHWRTHTGERPFNCLHCQKAFTQSSALNRHLKTCQLARFAVVGNLESQEPALVTGNEVLSICCGKNFYHRGALNVHLVSHDIYKCHCCNLDFENFSLLLMHMKSQEPRDQMPVSNSRDSSTDDYCVFCSASFHSIINQLVHIKTKHRDNASIGFDSDKRLAQDQINFENQPFSSSKTAYLNKAKSSKESKVLSSKKSVTTSLGSISSPKKQGFSRPNIGKISRFRQLMSSTFRMPFKLKTYAKHHQNKPEVHPTSTLAKRRYSILYPDQKLAGNVESTQCGTSGRNSFTMRRAIKRAMNNISKHRTISDRFTPSINLQTPTQTDWQQTTTSVIKRFLDQAESNSDITSSQMFSNGKKRQASNGSKPTTHEERIENSHYVQGQKKNLAAIGDKYDQGTIYYPEDLFNNDLHCKGSSRQVESSIEKNHRQPGEHLSQLGTWKGSSLKSRPSSSLLLKRSLLTRGLGKSSTEKNSSLDKVVQSPSKLNFRSSKYKNGTRLSMATGSKSSEFVCTICEKGFTSVSHLKQHLRTHTEEQSYACSSCNRFFLQKSAFDRHYKNCLYRNPKNLNLETSGNSEIPELSTNLLDDNKDSLEEVWDEEHLSLSSSLSSNTDTKDGHVLKETSVTSNNLYSIEDSQCQSDISKESSEKCKDCKKNSNLSCPHRGMYTSSSTSATKFSKYTIKIEPDSEAVTSDNTSRYDTFDVSVDPSQGNLGAHKNTDELTCSTDSSYLADHSLSQQAHIQKNQTEQQQTSGQLKFDLSRQLNSKLEHSVCTSPHDITEKSTPHTCKKCGDAFSEVSDLNQHKCLRRASSYTFSCEYCDKSFTRHSRLITHRRTHTGERPYKCFYCQRCFTQSSALNRHKKICRFIPAELKAAAMPAIVNS